MKRRRKLIGILLTLIMIMGMNSTAFAAGETGTITLDNPQKDQTYTAYKIFDSAYNAGKTAYSYTIKDNSEWFEAVKNYAANASNGIAVKQAPGSTNTYVVTITEGDFSAANFAETLKANMTGKTGKELTANGTVVEATGLELGYYFVSSTSGALCNLTTTNPSVTIHDKNDVPFEKTQSVSNVEIGQEVSYTITGKVPDTTGFTTYTYKVTDTMSQGLTFKKNVAVNIDGSPLPNSHYTLETTDTGFTLTIDVMELQAQVEKEIKITYSAVVNEDAVAVISQNEAKLEYSNDPTSNATNKLTDIEKVFSAKIKINKHEQGDQNTKLEKAEFVLMNGNGADAKYYQLVEAAGTDPAKVNWVDSIDNATKVTTDANGSAEFNGLKNGVYYLKETVAPEGYNLMTELQKVEINGNSTNVNSLSVTTDVANSTGTTLPSTGGMGTALIYIVGAALVIVAAIMLIVRRRMNGAK